MKIIISFIILVISGILFFVLVLPTWSQAKIVRGEVLVRQASLLNFREAIRARDELLQLRNSIPSEKLEQLRDAISYGPELNSLTRIFERVSTDAGLTLRRLDFTLVDDISENQQKSRIQQKAPEQPYKETQITSQLEGSYASLKSLLSVLESSVRLIDIHSLSFASGGAAGNTLIISLVARAYYGSR